ncbi:MAG TPA: hypothetical protein VF230_02940 [Acidimicrobiales bacterium]
MCNLRRIAVVALLAAAALVPVVRPAAASPAQCVVQGTVVTAAPLFYPAIGPFSAGAFDLGGVTCIPFHAATFNGQIGGWCGLANAFGVLSGHGFVADLRGGELVFSGTVVGRLTFTPDATSGESCVSGADRFLVTGTLTLV